MECWILSRFRSSGSCALSSRSVSWCRLRLTAYQSRRPDVARVLPRANLCWMNLLLLRAVSVSLSCVHSCLPRHVIVMLIGATVVIIVLPVVTVIVVTFVRSDTTSQSWGLPVRWLHSRYGIAAIRHDGSRICGNPLS